MERSGYLILGAGGKWSAEQRPERMKKYARRFRVRHFDSFEIAADTGPGTFVRKGAFAFQIGLARIGPRPMARIDIAVAALEDAPVELR
ncbi:hypothetical protein DF156_00595 [Burkholderia ubonensis]|nr:hypothetical protein DF156_00595 [Burkholderia ubonensis]RQP61649.1 hypothetical protein DF151_12450 [Burkholderia ubonensis]